MLRRDCPEPKTYSHAREHTRVHPACTARERDKKENEGGQREKERERGSVSVVVPLRGMGAFRISDIKVDTRAATRPLKYHEGHTAKRKKSLLPSISLSRLVPSLSLSLSLSLSHFLPLSPPPVHLVTACSCS